MHGSMVTINTSARIPQPMIEGCERDMFELASEFLGPELALLASHKPNLLSSLQHLVESTVACKEMEVSLMKKKLLLAASVGRGLQQELFKTKTDMNVVLLISKQSKQVHKVEGNFYDILPPAFDALASKDQVVLDLAVETILAALDSCSCAGALAEGMQAPCMYLVDMITRLTPWMEHFTATASTANGSNDIQAAAYAKLLAAAATAFMRPLHSFLEGKEPQALIRGMVAVRAYPAAAIAVEGELFWRILQESLEMAQAFERDLRLPEGQTMAASIEALYHQLLHALYDTAVLPEQMWETFDPQEQARMLQMRDAIAEPLIGAVGVLGFETCMEELMSSCARRQGQWSPQEAVLSCINILQRVCPPLAHPTLILVFETLCSLPRIGNLTATAQETTTLYTQWVIDTAQEAPEDGAHMLDQFCLFLDTEEVKAWNAMKARSETSELDSEDTSEASECDSDHQSSGSSVSAVDISDAESCSEFEQDLTETDFAMDEVVNQGISLVPGPVGPADVDRPMPTIQVAPALTNGAPERSYLPPMMNGQPTMPGGAPPAAPLIFRCPALQALLDTSAAPTQPELGAGTIADQSAPPIPSVAESCVPLMLESIMRHQRAAALATQPTAAASDASPRHAIPMPIGQPASATPGTFLGSLYWAAGALAGTVQGCASFRKFLI